MKEAKKTKTHPTFDAIHKKLKSKAMQFFVLIYKIFRMFRGFEQLSSAICWRVMTCSTCANPDTWWLLNDLCAPFLHYALSEEKHCYKPVWRSDKFPLWRESYVRKRFPMNKECTWMQKVYNSIKCVTKSIRLLTFVVELEMHQQRWWRNKLLNRTFSIASESANFRIRFSNFNGPAGDAMSYGSHNLNNQPFTTVDRDNDR